MHACPAGMAMTGLEVAENHLACARLSSPPAAHFIDASTQKMGMHACPGTNPGDPVIGVHVDRNLLLCGGTPAETAQGTIDASTQRNGMHSCPVGQFVLGIETARNLLICAPLPGDPASEIVDTGTQEQGMHACPDGMAMTGLEVAENHLACARLSNPPPAHHIDSSSQKEGMHGCPGTDPGDPVVGVHVDRNLLLCAGVKIPLPFNLESEALDPNGLPLNPTWAWQRYYPGETPPGSICHNFSKDVTQVVNGQQVTVKIPDFADCIGRVAAPCQGPPESCHKPVKVALKPVTRIEATNKGIETARKVHSI